MSSPIHLPEFVASCQRVLPALFRPVIAIANSAGPDSTCLLFLLRRIFPPDALLSVHVQHHLQPTAPTMAAVAAANAAALQVPHLTVHIPWGVHPFPATPTTSLERTARDARYNLLFRAISQARISLLALAHHADDQLETAIIRLAQGSSPLGAAGMRPIRRWGMGSYSPLASFGHRGLDTFILRPLLPFSKDRILATCHAHRLQYVDDPTNLQPHITARNAIRHCLRQNPPFSQPVSFPTTASLSFDKAKHAFHSLHSLGSDLLDQKNRLYSAIGNLAAKKDRVDRTVSLHLAESVLPSPTGTCLLLPQKLLQITDLDVRVALVLRVIRYVSFHPWGSLRADADRRQQSMHRIIRALWNSDPHPPHFKKFTAGGGVLWSPAIFNPRKSLRIGNYSHSVIHPDDRFCWLASRSPPFVKNPQQQGAGSPSKLEIDLSDQLRASISSDFPINPLQVLYDCRFLLCIDPSRIPAHVRVALREKTASVRVLPLTPYYSPKVVLQRDSHPDQVLAVPQENTPQNEPTSSSSWISIRWVRLLDAA